MKKIIIFKLTILSIFLIPVFMQNTKAEGQTGTLKVIVEGFDNDKGSAMIALCNSKEGFKNTDKAFNVAAASVKGGKAEWIFSNIPFGTYAVKVYHDENSNMKLDTNMVGMPTEFYGFSNNARGTFGPPKYEEAQFEVSKAVVTIKINVR